MYIATHLCLQILYTQVSDICTIGKAAHILATYLLRQCLSSRDKSVT